ncbi:hypothetical protein T484DRAFT_1823044 [Baffinella frigidus]|nr:hypothetical protein T484DRAFT_1823044 [Cryptophyta sp. CCMP2293]
MPPMLTSSALRLETGGTLQERDELFDERAARKDEVVLRGPWIFEQETNGTLQDLVLLYQDTTTHATIEIHDGPWHFERCDVRSARGKALELSMHRLDFLEGKDCGRHTAKLMEWGKLQVGDDYGEPSGSDDTTFDPDLFMNGHGFDGRVCFSCTGTASMAVSVQVQDCVHNNLRCSDASSDQPPTRDAAGGVESHSVAYWEQDSEDAEIMRNDHVIMGPDGPITITPEEPPVRERPPLREESTASSDEMEAEEPDNTRGTLAAHDDRSSSDVVEESDDVNMLPSEIQEHIPIVSCGFLKKPRAAIVTMRLCAVGGVSDSLDTRAILGLQAEERARVSAEKCVFEDTYSGVVASDSAVGDFRECIFRRNGVAVNVAECSSVHVQDSHFSEQRVANFATMKPPDTVSKYAIEGGNTGWGTISTPEYGVGEIDQYGEEIEVPWDETSMALKDPQLRLVNNKGDDNARMWWSPLRPPTLRGGHLVSEAGCTCPRVVCRTAPSSL